MNEELQNAIKALHTFFTETHSELAETFGKERLEFSLAIEQSSYDDKPRLNLWLFYKGERVNGQDLIAMRKELFHRIGFTQAQNMIQLPAPRSEDQDNTPF